MNKNQRSERKIVDDIIPNDVWLDKVCPSVLEFRRDSYILEQAYCTVYTIYNYPSEVGLKWLRPISLIENTMVSMFIGQGDKTNLLKSIDYTINEEQVRALSKGESQATVLVDSKAKIDKSLALSQRILSDGVNVGKITINIAVFAEDDKKLKQRCKDIEGRLSAYRFTIRKIPNMIAEGFDTFTPVGENKYEAFTALDMPLDVFFAGMGFIPSFGINDPTGLFLGFDESSNPIFLDIWEKTYGRTNMNMCVMGKSGSGKSAAVKDLLSHELMTNGTRVFILDPEEEYLSFADEFSGNVINAEGSLSKNGERTIINPLQLTDFPEEWDELTPEKIKEKFRAGELRGSLSTKIQTLRGWFKTYQPELNAAHIALIEKALYKTYANKGITELSDPRLMKNEDSPIMSDLATVLKEEEAKAAIGTHEKDLYGEILIYLNSIFEGSDRFLFNGVTNINLNNKFNVFNVHKLLDLPDHIKNAQFSNLCSYIWLVLTRNRQEKALLIVDEAHLFVNKGASTTFEFLGQLAKRARKYTSGLWVITQNIADFLHPDVEIYGAGILNNAANRLLMKSDANDLEKLTKIFDLNDGEKNLIKTADRGSGLLIAGDMSVFAYIKIEPSILELANNGGGN